MVTPPAEFTKTTLVKQSRTEQNKTFTRRKSQALYHLTFPHNSKYLCFVICYSAEILITNLSECLSGIVNG